MASCVSCSCVREQVDDDAAIALALGEAGGGGGVAVVDIAEQQRQRRAQDDDDEAMRQAIALSLAAAGRAAEAEQRPTTAGGREAQIVPGLLLHIYWDPAWDASESALRPGGTTYWSGDVNSALGPSEWMSAHQDPEEDTLADRQVRARILRNHPALRDPAG
jgi:hypothetical protein